MGVDVSVCVWGGGGGGGVWVSYLTQLLQLLQFIIIFWSTEVINCVALATHTCSCTR